jgi:hypothetical protein
VNEWEFWWAYSDASVNRWVGEMSDAFVSQPS